MKNDETHYKGIVTEINFFTESENIVTVVRFDNGYVIAFHDYQLCIPKNMIIMFKYHFKYFFNKTTPIYELDDFSFSL